MTSRRLELSVSIVTYRTPRPLLETVWATLTEACRRVTARGGACCLSLVLVDNTDPPDPEVEAFRGAHAGAPIALTSGHGNVGYGRGHNLAIEGVESDYHLVLNPDVELNQEAIAEAFEFMQAHPQCGLLGPAVFDEHGQRQFLCKRYPSLLDFVLRGFAPAWLAERFRRRLDRYEMRDLIGEDVAWDPDVISGCFMFFRTDVLKRLGGFDPRFFLYLEDFDLSLRAAEISRIAYVPRVRIVHHGGHAARKGWRHVLMFASSAVKFYRKHGWRVL